MRVGVEIKNQTINDGNQQVADNIINHNKEIETDNYIEGNVTGGNVAGRDIHIHYNISSTEDKSLTSPKTILGDYSPKVSNEIKPFPGLKPMTDEDAAWFLVVSKN